VDISVGVVLPLCAGAHFGDRAVWVAALELGDGEPWRGADSMTVVFDADLARNLGLSP
jgi:hypothetical protein